MANALESLAPQMKSMEDRYAFETWGFDPELTPVGVDALRAAPPRASRTDLFSALRAIKAGGDFISDAVMHHATALPAAVIKRAAIDRHRDHRKAQQLVKPGKA